MKLEKIKQLAGKKVFYYHDILVAACTGQKVSYKNRMTFLGDILDLKSYYFLVSEGDYKKAYSLQFNLDTDVRDQILISVFEFVRNEVEK